MEMAGEITIIGGWQSRKKKSTCVLDDILELFNEVIQEALSFKLLIL